MKFSTTKTVVFTLEEGILKFVKHDVEGNIDLVQTPHSATDFGGKGMRHIAAMCQILGIYQDEQGRWPFMEVDIECTIDDALLAQLDDKEK